MGELIKIYSRPARLAEVVELEEAEAVVGTGIEGDHFKKGSRQVTLLSKQAWDDACRDIGHDLDPKLSRRNFLIDSLDFNDSLGKVVHIGDIAIEITGETKPCRLMDDAVPGLKAALTPNWRGGAFGVVITPGVVAVGDSVIFWEAPRFKLGDRVLYTPTGEDRKSWPGIIAKDPEGKHRYHFSDSSGATWVAYAVLFDDSRTGRVLPEDESQLELMKDGNNTRRPETQA